MRMQERYKCTNLPITSHLKKFPLLHLEVCDTNDEFL